MKSFNFLQICYWFCLPVYALQPPVARTCNETTSAGPVNFSNGTASCTGRGCGARPPWVPSTSIAPSNASSTTLSGSLASTSISNTSSVLSEHLSTSVTGSGQVGPIGTTTSTSAANHTKSRTIIVYNTASATYLNESAALQPSSTSAPATLVNATSSGASTANTNSTVVLGTTFSSIPHWMNSTFYLYSTTTGTNIMLTGAITTSAAAMPPTGSLNATAPHWTNTSSLNLNTTIVLATTRASSLRPFLSTAVLTSSNTTSKTSGSANMTLSTSANSQVTFTPPPRTPITILGTTVTYTVTATTISANTSPVVGSVSSSCYTATVSVMNQSTLATPTTVLSCRVLECAGTQCWAEFVTAPLTINAAPLSGSPISPPAKTVTVTANIQATASSTKPFNSSSIVWGYESAPLMSSLSELNSSVSVVNPASATVVAPQNLSATTTSQVSAHTRFTYQIESFTTPPHTFSTMVRRCENIDVQRAKRQQLSEKPTRRVPLKVHQPWRMRLMGAEQ